MNCAWGPVFSKSFLPPDIENWRRRPLKISISFQFTVHFSVSHSAACCLAALPELRLPFASRVERTLWMRLLVHFNIHAATVLVQRAPTWLFKLYCRVFFFLKKSLKSHLTETWMSLPFIHHVLPLFPPTTATFISCLFVSSLVKRGAVGENTKQQYCKAKEPQRFCGGWRRRRREKVFNSRFILWSSFMGKKWIILHRDIITAIL